ncbi:hypothetical protein GmHk_03G007217 [Glycine max]|nr:hypothetical protein GmHk_03G007217 [Glycine max]
MCCLKKQKDNLALEREEKIPLVEVIGWTFGVIFRKGEVVIELFFSALEERNKLLPETISNGTKIWDILLLEEFIRIRNEFYGSNSIVAFAAKKIDFETMATSPASPPPPPIVASVSLSTQKRTRKVTQLRSLATRPPGAERPVVNVDPATGKADGPHKKKLRTYLGIVARDKVDMTYGTWKEVTAARNLKSLKLLAVGQRKKFFRLSTSGRGRNGYLQPTRTVWTTLSVKNTTLARRNEPSFDVRKKAQVIQKQNTATHVLSRRGYNYLEQKLMAEKTKKKLEETAQFRSTEGVINPPSPIRRHDSLEEQASQGSFIPHGRQDVLTAAIGRPQHLGRVHAARAGVTIKQYFRSAARSSCSSSSIPHEELEQLTQQIRDQLEESIREKVTR